MTQTIPPLAVILAEVLHPHLFRRWVLAEGQHVRGVGDHWIELYVRSATRMPLKMMWDMQTHDYLPAWIYSEYERVPVPPWVRLFCEHDIRKNRYPVFEFIGALARLDDHRL